MRALLGAAALLAALACKPAPLPEDPAQLAYRRAVRLFAALSADAGDLFYRDPRFDGVLELLAEVPPGSEPFPKAQELARRIRAGRAEAEREDEAQARAVDEALGDPNFRAVGRWSPVKPASAAAPAPAAADAAPGVGAGLVGGAPGFQPGGRGVFVQGIGQLPDWYRQAGYFGLGGSPLAAEPAASASAPPAADPTGAAAPSPSPARPRQAASSATAPSASPAVYGVPGPAGRALRGLP